MQVFSQALLTAFISFAVYINGNDQSAQNFNKVTMKNWSLGRIDFNLPQQYELLGRTQNIYYVFVSTSSVKDKTADEIWNNKLKNFKEKHLNAGNSEKTLNIKEIELGFKAIFYQENSSDPEIIKLDAQKTINKNILEMSFEGKVGKESDMQRGFSNIANAYRQDVPYGFNVGAGSITSTPGVNEHTAARFNDKENAIDINISTRVATKYLERHPLDDIENEIKGLASDGVTLKILKNEERTVAGFEDREGFVSFDDGKEEPKFRLTWFTPGVTADSFKPEIRIMVYGTLKNIESFKPVWEDLLRSLKIRSAN